jgi:hypothetical protein
MSRYTCGICKHFHTPECPRETPKLIAQGLYTCNELDKPFDDHCFELDEEKLKVLLSEPVEKEEDVYKTPFILTGTLIAEECYIKSEGKTYFAVRYFEGNKVELVEKVEVGDKTFVPLNNPTLEKGLILLPREPRECGFQEAFEEGCHLASTLYDCEPEKMDELYFLVAIAQASWFLDRYFHEIFIPGMGAFAPIIALRGPSGSGKDRLLNALRFNSIRPFYDVSTKRVPSLYRPLDQWRGTLCLSEMDFRLTSEYNDLTHYLNCRTYGVPISRQNPDNPRVNEVFYNFGLTIVTQRRVWQDNALEDRAIPFYCEKSQKPLPTLELDEWIEKGITLQNKLLYLRLMFWDKVKIDKGARIQGLKDHRLTSAILPLLALSQHVPALNEILVKVVQNIERRRREVKAISRDGLIINELYEFYKDGFIGEHNGIKYIAKSKGKKPNGEDFYIPLQTSDLAEKLQWSTREVRSLINSLQLHPSLEILPKVIRLDRTYRPIWVDERRLITRFEEFVPDYSSVTFVTDVTLKPSVQQQGNNGAKQLYNPAQIKSVTSVTNVTSPEVGVNVGALKSVSEELKRIESYTMCHSCKHYVRLACELNPHDIIIPTARTCEKYEPRDGNDRA